MTTNSETLLIRFCSCCIYTDIAPAGQTILRATDRVVRLQLRLLSPHNLIVDLQPDKKMATLARSRVVLWLQEQEALLYKRREQTTIHHLPTADRGRRDMTLVPGK